ncbi:MAG TPA: DUF2970 domain-containing protein [Crenotrichaceae bacterium]|nr:DUF2970 domain-containing protein [Crenotrichaceae bacterium]
MKNSDHQSKSKLTLLQTLGSVLAAFGGVQNMDNLRRDFNSDSAWRIVAIGIIVTVIFVLLVIFAARHAAS